MTENPSNQAATAAIAASPGPARGLRRGVLSQWEVVFQAVTHLGPAITVIASVPVLGLYVGASIPIVLTFAMIATLLTAGCVVSLSRHLPSAAGYYTFVSHGLGKPAGYFTAWAYFLYDPLIPALVITYPAYIISTAMQDNLGFSIPWWALTVVLLLVIHGSSYFGVKPSAKFNLTMGLIEVVIMVALGITLLAHPGKQGLSTVPFHFPSMSGGVQFLVLGLVFALLDFTGFESAAPLAEETANPRRAIPRTVIFSTIGCGLLWILLAYGAEVGYGVSHVHAFATAENPFFTLARNVWGAGWGLVVFALLNSCLAGGLAGTTAGTRVLYSLGKAGALPKALGRVHPKHQTPYVAITAQTVLSIAIALIVGFWQQPIGVAINIGLMVTLGVIVVYILGDISVVRLYRTTFRSEWNLFRHGIVPGLACLALGTALYYSVIPLPTGSLRVAIILVAIWLVIGLVLAGVLARRRGSALEVAAQIVADAGEAER